MADNLKLRFDVEIDKGQTERAGQDIKAMLDRALKRVGEDASSFTSGMKRGIEEIATIMGDKVRGVFTKSAVDAQPLAEEVGETVSQTLRQKVAQALVVNGKVLAGFADNELVLDSNAFRERYGELMFSGGGEKEFAAFVNAARDDLSEALTEAERLAANGEEASTAYQNLSEMIEVVTNSLRELYGVQSATMGLTPDASQGDGSEFVGGVAEVSHRATLLSTIYDRLENDTRVTMEAIKSSVSGAFSTIGDKLSNFYNNTDILSHRFVGIVPNIKSAFTNSFVGVIPNMNAMAEGVGRVTTKFGQLATVTGSTLKKGVGGLISKFKQMGTAASKSADQASKKMKRMTIQMIKAGLGVRGLYMLVRKLRQAIKEGMDTLAQNVPEFNKVFSDFKTAVNGIKGSVGTAFQPILQVVLPILSQLANALSNVLVLIAKFNAVLTGQGYIYKFTAAQQDYAKSLKGTGGAAKKATKDLMGFDEINRLSDKNSGGGGGSSGIGDYEKELIDQEGAISKFAEMVKAAWAVADFTEVGRTIGEGIKEGLQSVTDFLDTEGQKWAKHFASSLSTLINGLVDVEGLGNSIGTAIGSALNVGITFLRDFWRDTNWEGIGEQLGGAINGLFDKVDWDGLGEYFGYKFNGIFSFIGGLADSTQWINMGTDIANGINSMIQTLDLGEAVSNVCSLIVGLFQSGISFVTTTDWKAIGEEVADGLANIDWAGVLGNAGTLITKGAQGILDMFIAFLKKTDWKKLTTDILNGIAKMFENVWDDGKLVQKLAEGIGSLLAAAFEVFWSIGNWIYDHVVVPLGEALSEQFSFDVDGPWYEVGWNIIQGIFSGITNALIGIGKWINDNIVQPMIDAICEFFGIHSPSTVMAGIGGDLIAGLFEGLKGIWDAVCGIFETLKENIIGVFEDIGSGISTVWENIKSGVSEAWGAIKTTIVNIVSGIMRVVTGQFNNLKEGVLAIFRFIRDTAGLIWDGMCTVFTTIFEALKQALETLFGWIVDFLEWTYNRVQDILGLLSATDTVKMVETYNQVASGGVSGGVAGSFREYKIPKLASGAVLPPNQPFLSMVGDQTSGTNVEAPLETIKQAVAEVLLDNNELLATGFEAVVAAIQNKDMSVRIGDKDVYEANSNYEKRLNTMRGTV